MPIKAEIKFPSEKDIKEPYTKSIQTFLSETDMKEPYTRSIKISLFLFIYLFIFLNHTVFDRFSCSLFIFYGSLNVDK